MRGDGGAPVRAVAVSGLHRGDNPQPGAAVIASLRRHLPELRVIGLSYDPMESGLFSRLGDRLDSAYLLPFPAAGAGALKERLDAVLEREEIDLIIPCLDSEILNFIAIADHLFKRGVHTVLPAKKSFERRRKETLTTFCRRLGLEGPETRTSDDLAVLQRCAAKLGYPVLVKGKYYGAYLANTEIDLRIAFDELVRIWGGPVLVQEILAGEEYDVVGLGDGRGDITGQCAIRKMLRTHAGKGFAGVVVADPELDRLSRRIIGALRWNGPFELEFIKGPGKPHILYEMNPRFPAWIDFPSQLGCNLPGHLLARRLGGAVAPLRRCEAGQLFVRHCVDLAGDIADFATMASSGERRGEPAGAAYGVRA